MYYKNVRTDVEYGGNSVIQKKERERLMKHHRERIRNMKSALDMKCPEDHPRDLDKGDLRMELQMAQMENHQSFQDFQKRRLEMRPGTTTAIVGKSGGGKSTLVHLLMRFYEPTDGSILLDGKDMKDLSSRAVRTFCGFVSQDTQLFASSIEENLCYGLGREHTREEMEEACKAANAHDFIMEMEDKELFAAMLYTCYELIQPDVALEVAWRSDLMVRHALLHSVCEGPVNQSRDCAEEHRRHQEEGRQGRAGEA